MKPTTAEEVRAEDLMIGNWVEANYPIGGHKDKWEPIRVESVGPDGIDASAIWEGGIEWTSFRDLRPILLTPELLEKCGFVRLKHIFTTQELTLIIQSAYGLEVCVSFPIHRNEELGPCLINTASSPDGEQSQVTSFDLQHIKYLHQLQNLTHSLGTQLTISL